MKNVLSAFGMVIAITASIHVRAAIFTNEIPSFRGDTWSIAAPDDGFVAMLVFHSQTGKVSVYTYDKAAGGVLTELTTINYEATPTGYRAQDSNGQWHSWDVVDNDHLIVDGQNLPITKTTSQHREIVGAPCAVNCAWSCNNAFYECCACCFCVHECMHISFMNWLCCFYIGGCGL